MMERDASASMPALPIRSGMDVYSSYQNQYLGAVVGVWRQIPGTSPEPSSHEGSKTPGEGLGPFPTVELGNTGPAIQNPRHGFATASPALPGVVLFSVRPGRVNLGPLSSLLYVPSSAVRSLSMERVVLDVQRGQMPDAWRRQPKV